MPCLCEMHKNMAFVLYKFADTKNSLCMKNAGCANFYQRKTGVVVYSYKVRNTERKQRRKEKYAGN